MLHDGHSRTGKLRMTKGDRFIPSNIDSGLRFDLNKMVELKWGKDDVYRESETPLEKALHTEVFSDVMFKKVFSLTNNSGPAVRPRKRVVKAPSLVSFLDASGMLSDFYSNTLTWLDNVIGISISTDVYIANVTNTTTPAVRVEFLSTPYSLRSLGDERTLAVGTETGNVYVYDVMAMTHTSMYKSTLDDGKVNAMSFSKGYNILACSGANGSIHFRDLRMRGNIFHMHKAHGGAIAGLEWNAGGRHLASGGNDDHIKVWDISSRSPGSDGVDRVFDRNQVFEGKHDACVKGICWSPGDQRLLLTGGGNADRRLRLWDIGTGKMVKETKATSQVSGVHWSDKGDVIISGHSDHGNIKMWGPRELNLLNTLDGHTGGMICMSVNKAETMLSTVCRDGALKIWGLAQPARKRVKRVPLHGLGGNCADGHTMIR